MRQDISPENVVVLQEQKGFDAMVKAIMDMGEKKLQILNQRRETLPLSDLCIGMQCGGSDAFSGVSAKSVCRLCGRYAGKCRCNGHVFRGNRGA